MIEKDQSDIFHFNSSLINHMIKEHNDYRGPLKSSDFISGFEERFPKRQSPVRKRSYRIYKGNLWN